jgi:hypothetical protein
MGFGKGKGKRGGGKKMYVANIEELQLRNAEVDEAQKARRERRGDSDEEDDDDANGNAGASATAGEESVFSFEDKKKVGLIASATGSSAKNANKSKSGPEKMLKAKDVDFSTVGTGEGGDATAGMNRKEREQMEAVKRREEYQRKTMAGETDEARANLARLALVRKRREEAAAKRENEGRKPGMSANGQLDDDYDPFSKKQGDDSGSDDSGSDDSSEEEAPVKSKHKVVKELTVAEKKRAKATATVDTSAPKAAGDTAPKLKSIEIKKMNPAQLKDALKEREQGIQGNKKDLEKRLLAFEAARA